MQRRDPEPTFVQAAKSTASGIVCLIEGRRPVATSFAMSKPGRQDASFCDDVTGAAVVCDGD
jgi:hypothetical protein